MEEKYHNMIDEWCEVLEGKAYKKQHGFAYGREKNTYFYYKVNKKYTKIIKVNYSQESVHAFIENKTLDIYKAANWAAPAKGVRYNLLNDFNELLGQCDPSGAYLYKRGKNVTTTY